MRALIACGAFQCFTLAAKATSGLYIRLTHVMLQPHVCKVVVKAGKLGLTTTLPTASYLKEKAYKKLFEALLYVEYCSHS